MDIQTESEVERIRVALNEAIKIFKPNPRRVVFYHLKPFHDKIVEWRSMQASYSIIARMLKGQGVKTSKARVAEYGRVVLEGKKPRKRKRSRRSF